MLLALDESGRDGLSPAPGRPPWLVIGGVLFPTRPAAEACEEALRGLKAQLGVKEFHYSKTDDKRRRQVLECLAGQNLTYHVAICDRSALILPRWRGKSPADLYFAVAGLLARAVSPQLQECNVRFDTLGGKGPNRQYAGMWQRVAGQTPDGVKRVKSCTGCDSRAELIVQAADFVCGSVVDSLPPESDPTFLRLIRRREGVRVVWTDSPLPNAVVQNEEGGQLSPPASPE